MKRRYTKRNCNYWGHSVRFVRVAIDQDTKETIAYYGICKRCSKKVFINSNGKKVDNACVRHLVDVTLQDLPEPII